MPRPGPIKSRIALKLAAKRSRSTSTQVETGIDIRLSSGPRATDGARTRASRSIASPVARRNRRRPRSRRNMTIDRSMVLAVMTGVALAAACGLRAFLPLLVAGVASRFGLLSLGPNFTWLGENPALVALGLATVLEMVGDKIPVVDHALDVAGTVIR